jgi:NADH-quinone oxidoreductase subunit I
MSEKSQPITQPKNAGEGYFRDIYDSLKSILIGMRITLKYCFSRVVTIQYPYEKLAFAPRYRGIHELEADKCIACDMCAKACPVDCIYIDKSAPRKIDKKTGTAVGGELLRYAIDYQKCMFCALCTEPCPTDCIHMGKNHDLSSYTRQDMVVEFQELDKKGLRTPIPLWMDRNAATIPWVAKERERIVKGELATTEADIPAI